MQSFTFFDGWFEFTADIGEESVIYRRDGTSYVFFLIDLFYSDTDGPGYGTHLATFRPPPARGFRWTVPTSYRGFRALRAKRTRLESDIYKIEMFVSDDVEEHGRGFYTIALRYIDSNNRYQTYWSYRYQY